jgi:hypothetical protein
VLDVFQHGAVLAYSTNALMSAPTAKPEGLAEWMMTPRGLFDRQALDDLSSSSSTSRGKSR